ncbi:MAG: hypothetical protein AB1798_05620 [Spirochaetota bacterium]
MKPVIKKIFSQTCWIVKNNQVEVAITELGGQMAPVTFYRDEKESIQPYYISPWQNEKTTIDVPVLVPLRGDFFCMPFGGNNTYKKEEHPVHGETASSMWTFDATEKENGITRLTLSMNTKVRPGKVTKSIFLIDGHNVVYLQHKLEGFSDKMALGHHATLAPPEEPDSLLIATSPILFGMIAPRKTGPAAEGEYYSLAPGKKFAGLSKVPTIWKDMPYDDCSSFPRRKGFIDVLQFYAKRQNTPAWTAVSVPSRGYLWFALKDPVILPSTVVWTENHGRHLPPWSGRNCCIGLEDVCSFFAEGLGASAKKNFLNAAGIPTSITLSTVKLFYVNYIQGVVKIPRGFGRVKSVKFKNNTVDFLDQSGKAVTASVCYDFLSSGKIC